MYFGRYQHWFITRPVSKRHTGPRNRARWSLAFSVREKHLRILRYHSVHEHIRSVLNAIEITGKYTTRIGIQGQSDHGGERRMGI